MKRFARPRRSPWLVLALVVIVLAAAAAVAVAGLQPANLSYTPNSESQVTNIDVARAWIKNYYGAPGARTGPNGDWTASLNTTSNYADEARSVAKQGASWLAANKPKSSEKKAIVLDVDDTTLTTWNYELYSNWDYNPGTNGNFVTDQLFPATPGMVDMVSWAADKGYAVFFITGRPLSQRDATLGNLNSDGVGVDAGYPTPTTIDLTGEGDVGPGLFTKPPIGDYPDYLDTDEFCADAIANDRSCATIPYKAGTRAYIESQGYEIVGDFGDQFSDLEGGYADKTFKMPNPNYYLP